MRRSIIISKCSLVMRDRSGVKILPPNKNSSTDALDSSPVFRVTATRDRALISFFQQCPSDIWDIGRANCHPSWLPQQTQNTQRALPFSACQWNLWHCSTLPLWLFYYLFGREASLLVFYYYPKYDVRTRASPWRHACYAIRYIRFVYKCRVLFRN